MYPLDNLRVKMNDAIQTIIGIQKEIYHDYKNKSGIENTLIRTIKEEHAKMPPLDSQNQQENDKENHDVNESSQVKVKKEEMKESEKESTASTD